MAKRFEPINNFGAAKKLKLDVSVNRGRLKTPSPTIVDFWDNDDDDVILLATQLAEEKQHRHERNPGIEFNFSQFAPEVHGTTSTQQLLVEPSHGLKTPAKLPMDNLCSMNLSRSWNTEEVFGTDETFVFLPDQQNSEHPVANAPESNTSCATTTRRQLAHERQLKFLMERVDALKKLNTKLMRDLTDSTNNAKTKDGEVNVLRDELRQVRKLLQASKMEKIAMAEEAAKDCTEKVHEVYKQVIAKDTELSFVNVEFTEQRMRVANKPLKDGPPMTLSDVDQNRNLLRLENLHIGSSSSRQLPIGDQVYKYVEQTTSQNKQRNFFEIELEKLLLLNAQLDAHSNTDKSIISCIISSVCRVFVEFWSYANSLELPKHFMMYAHRHSELQLNHSINSLTQPETLYHMERAILLRRYIATLATICQQKYQISQALLDKKHGNHLIIQLAIQAIIKISYSFEISEHFGILKATAALLKSLLQHVTSLKGHISEQYEEMLFGLLKQLVFSCPSPSVFHELSSCFILCTRQTQLMAKMCVNSRKDCFVSDRVRYLYRFGTKSCLIQVYACLLELCFGSHLPLQPSQFKLLLSICGNHVRFVYQCFTVTPEFILKMLPLSLFTDEEKKQCENMIEKFYGIKSNVTVEHNTIAQIEGSVLSSASLSDFSLVPVADKVSHDGGCECYVKLCLSVVTLVFQMMYHWTLQNNKSDILQVAEISQIAVHLFTFIFGDYYVSCLLRDSEETTKHYLSLICSWWTEHSSLLNFGETQLRFLKQLQDLQFMWKPLHQEGNPCNTNSDCAEWKETLKNIDAIQISNQTNVKLDSLFMYKTSEFFNGLKKTACSFDE